MVGQLGGGVGSLAGQGPRALAVRARFCDELGLGDPGISWLTARDRIAEVGGVLAMVTGTLARIGNEVFELQRPELGELREPVAEGTVGSITMPHKRNPEHSEHLDTLARLTRASAGVLLEGMSGVHERDGRSWKAEWVALPEVCLLAATACAFTADLLGGLEVDADAMGRNLDDYTGSEQALRLLGAKVGRHEARAALQAVLAAGRRTGTPMSQALLDAELIEPDELATLEPDVAAVGEMVDLVVARAREARAADEAKARWVP
jgi:adenylosuccinate lyase